MTTRQRSVGPLLAARVWSSRGGVVLAFPRLATTIETQLYTRRIPTAPPLSVQLTPGIAQTVLLPADDGSAVLIPTVIPSSTPPLSVEVEAEGVVRAVDATPVVTAALSNTDSRADGRSPDTCVDSQHRSRCACGTDWLDDDDSRWAEPGDLGCA